MKTTGVIRSIDELGRIVKDKRWGKYRNFNR